MRTAAEIIAAGTPFLLLAAARIARRRIHRQQPDRLAWIDDRIRTRPDERHAWRQLKKLMEEDLWQQ